MALKNEIMCALIYFFLVVIKNDVIRLTKARISSKYVVKYFQIDQGRAVFVSIKINVTLELITIYQFVVQVVTFHVIKCSMQ